MNTQMPSLPKPLPPSLATVRPPSMSDIEARRLAMNLAPGFQSPNDVDDEPLPDDGAPDDLRWLAGHRQRLARLARSQARHHARRGGLRYGGGEGEVDDNTFASAQTAEDNALRIVGAVCDGDGNHGSHSGSGDHSDTMDDTDVLDKGEGAARRTTRRQTSGPEEFAEALDTLLKHAGLGADATQAADEQVDAALHRALVLAAESVAAGGSMSTAFRALIGRFRRLHACLPGPRKTSLAATATQLGPLPEKLDAHSRRFLSSGNGFLLLPLVHLAMTRGEGASNEQ